MVKLEVFNNILGWIGDKLNELLSFLCLVLPDSPFKLLDYTPISDILPYINYFIPIDFMLDLMSAWLACILLYYGYSIILRWIKAIG